MVIFHCLFSQVGSLSIVSSASLSSINHLFVLSVLHIYINCRKGLCLKISQNILKIAKVIGVKVEMVIFHCLFSQVGSLSIVSWASLSSINQEDGGKACR